MVSLSYPDDLEDSFPTPASLSKDLPIDQTIKTFVHKSRETIINILQGTDPRILLIVGPCSVHDRKSSLEYAHHLKELSEQVKDQFYMVMRTYFEKPRTVYGWKGFLYDPHLDGTHDIATGLYIARELLIELAKNEIPAATELLEIVTTPYLSDLLSWGCIGARTSNSPPHRQLAATLPFPVGFKNTTCGSIDNAANACLSARAPHAFLGVNSSGELRRLYGPGNPNCHIVLRGGEEGPNFDLHSISTALDLLKQRDLTERVVVDCSHDNSQKQPSRQIPIFESLLQEIDKGNQAIRGIMLESHLFEGRQSIPLNLKELKYGVSITDPCLSFATTKSVLLRGRAMLCERNLVTV